MLQDAINILLKEGIVAIPTETVYGLAALATSDSAVLKVYDLKQRPSFNPLIVHISDFEMMKNLVDLKPEDKAVCSYFWDAKKPLTVVLPLKENHGLSSFVTSGLKTVAIRMPHHPITLDLIKKTGPLAAPSANISNSVSPTSSDHVRQSFKEKCPHILEGGHCSVGLESTILDLSSNDLILLRPGGVSLEELESYFKKEISLQKGHKILAPGMMKLHYSPGCPVLLNTVTIEEGGILIGYGPNAPDYATFNLSESGDLFEAARNLFDVLNKIALIKPKSVSVMPIPDVGIGLAINDRLNKAAAR